MVNADSIKGDFKHYWKKVIASSHAHTALRVSYQNALQAVREEAGFDEVRFHGIFHDLNGVYNEDEDGNVKCNFYIVAQIYDALVAKGMRPFVELSFMPKQLCSTDKTIFVWRGGVALPNDWDKYREMIRQFVVFLIDRYGIDEVINWKFEVWNEPDLGGFRLGNDELGIVDKDAYYQLYAAATKTVKSVDERLLVGGPATARCSWVGDFIKHCSENDLPLDFISTHLYREDQNLGTIADWVAGDRRDSKYNVVSDYVKACVGGNDFMKKVFATVKSMIDSSGRPELPLYITEYGPFWGAVCPERDSEYAAAFICQSVYDHRGTVDGLAYWTFSDDFEERGVMASEFSSNFGLITRNGIYKPGFNAYCALAKLGDVELHSEGDIAHFATCRGDQIQILVWNERPDDQLTQTVSLGIDNLPSECVVRHLRIDGEHSNAYSRWLEMGSPEIPSPRQIEMLKSRMRLEECEPWQSTQSGYYEKTMTLPPNSISLLILDKA